MTQSDAASVSYSVRLSHADVERLRAAAAREGVGATALARAFIRAGLARAEEDGGDPASLVERLRHDVDELAAALRRQRSADPTGTDGMLHVR
jgi:hypothetical protein